MFSGSGQIESILSFGALWFLSRLSHLAREQRGQHKHEWTWLSSSKSVFENKQWAGFSPPAVVQWPSSRPFNLLLSQMIILYLLAFLNLPRSLSTLCQVFCYGTCSLFYENIKKNQKERIGPSVFSGWEPIHSAFPPTNVDGTSIFLFEANPTLVYWTPSHLLYLRESSRNPILFFLYY